MTFNYASGWLEQDFLTTAQQSLSGDTSEPMDFRQLDTSTRPLRTDSGPWYGTETTRKLWSQIAREGRSVTSGRITRSEEIKPLRLSYDEAMRFLRGTS